MKKSWKSVAGDVMDEAIELSLEGDSPYPDRALFLDADSPYAGVEIVRATDEGMPVVLVSPDGTSRVLEPGRKIEARRAQAPKAA